jgi:acetate kinase
MEEENYIYAIPYKYYKKYKIRKYGFHGISHEFVYNKLIQNTEFKMQKKKDLKVITCHVGNGASISAIKNGKVIQNSM